jgi:hypothetical protein
MSSENFNFDEIAQEAVHNEPPRKQLPPDIEQNIDIDQEMGAQHEYEANAKYLVPGVVEGIAALWREAFGNGQGKELSAEEKDGFTSLLQKGAEEFGMTSHLSGKKGFFTELVLKLLGALFPRFTNKEAREHFKSLFINHKKEESDDGNTVQPDPYAGLHPQGGSQNSH